MVLLYEQVRILSTTVSLSPSKNLVRQFLLRVCPFRFDGRVGKIPLSKPFQDVSPPPFPACLFLEFASVDFPCGELAEISIEPRFITVRLLHHRLFLSDWGRKSPDRTESRGKGHVPGIPNTSRSDSLLNSSNDLKTSLLDLFQASSMI